LVLGGENVPTISCFQFEENIDKKTVIEKVNMYAGFEAQESKFKEDEIYIRYTYSEPLEKILARLVGKDWIEEILKDDKTFQVAMETLIMKTICVFMNLKIKTVEIYSGNKKLVDEIIKTLEDALGIKLYWLMNEEEIKVKPRIKHLNSRGYSVVIRQNKLIFNRSKNFIWRPRYEIRQIVEQIATLGRLY
jgi:hypothetical protein